MRILTLALCLLAFRLHAAVGDVLSIVGQTDGWQFQTAISGLVTNNGIFNNRFRSNSTPSQNSLLFRVTGPGFTAPGVSNLVTRTQEFTVRIRQPYPQQTNALQTQNASEITNWVASSRKFYAGETITASGKSFYSSGGTSNNYFTNLSVLNLSQSTYKTVQANWTWPGYNIIQTNIMRLSVVGGHGQADGTLWGQPLAGVRFIVRNQSGTAVTNDVTELSIDWSLNRTANFIGLYGFWMDLQPAEYIADIDLSGFSQGDRLRCDFEAYPRYGTNYFSTLQNQYVGHDYRGASFTNLYDPGDIYSKVIAVVDEVSGSDVNGRARMNTNYTPASIVAAGEAVATKARAQTIVAASNNAFFGHNDVGGATIYLRGNVTRSAGATISGAGLTQPQGRLLVQNYPAERPIISGNGGSTRHSDLETWRGISFAVPSATIIFNQMGAIWIDQAPSMTNVSSQPFLRCTNTWITRSAIGNWTRLGPSAAGDITAVSLRGNNLSGFNDRLVIAVCIGNVHPDTNGPNYVVSEAFSGMQLGRANQILYGNYFGGGKGVNSLLNIGESFTMTNGIFIANNLFEYSTNSAPAILGTLGTQNTLQYTNLIFWHNTFVGQREAFGYNDIGTTTAWREDWSPKGNLWSELGIKSDVFGTPSQSRTGNWEVVWGVNASHNMRGEVSAYGANSQEGEFYGVYTYSQTAPTGELPPWYEFSLDLSNWGTRNFGGMPPGGGNYAPKWGSPVLIITAPGVLQYDLIGRKHNAPGAYSAPPNTWLIPPASTLVLPTPETYLED